MSNTVQYMDAQGYFVESCQVGTPPNTPGAVEAPPGGAYGMRWLDGVWVVVPPVPNDCTKFQGLRALGRVRAQQIESVIAHLDIIEIDGEKLSDDAIWSIRTAWESAGSWERSSPDLAFIIGLFGWDDAMRDDFFRWIGSGNTGVFP